MEKQKQIKYSKYQLYQKRWYKRNRDKVLLYMKNYNKNPKVKEKKKIYNKTWYNKPENIKNRNIKRIKWAILHPRPLSKIKINKLWKSLSTEKQLRLINKERKKIINEIKILEK